MSLRCPSHQRLRYNPDFSSSFTWGYFKENQRKTFQTIVTKYNWWRYKPEKISFDWESRDVELIDDNNHPRDKHSIKFLGYQSPGCVYYTNC